jgi:cell division transport system permease protein
MRIGFFIREAFRALRRSAAPSLAAALTILLTALVLGVFIPIVQATTGKANEVRGRVVVDVYVSDAAGDREIERLRTALAALDNVQSVEFISKEEAIRNERKRNPEAYDILGDNPLPDSFRVTPDDPDLADEMAAQLAPPPKGAKGAEATRNPALEPINDVRNREEETQKILSATALVKTLAFGLAGLLVLASIALVANTIRLSIFARRREVEIMRLVGATNWFIRWPFVIEGIVVGVAGGGLAIALLALAKVSVIDSLQENFALLAAPDTVDFPVLAIMLLASCIMVSAIGSGLTLRRFLRI